MSMQDAMTIARASYERCSTVPDFFAAFYARFFERRPEAKALFTQTAFDRQHKLLRHAIGLLLTFPGQPNAEPNILMRVAERHSRRELGIDPSHYPQFLESLIDTVKRCDPQFTPAVERAWRVSVAPGFAYMQSRY
ncbi:MAG TPA: globin [Gemmatimonadales bacterium]|nr:globin [Gemmatimonadales bacterium]